MVLAAVAAVTVLRRRMVARRATAPDGTLADGGKSAPLARDDVSLQGNPSAHTRES
jgi:hypothetical protein